MTDTNKILIGVGVAGALGVGIWLLTKKPGSTTTTTTTGGGEGSNQSDPSTNTVDSLGTTLGNLFSELFAKKEKEKNPIGTTCEAPADPFTSDGIKKEDYSSNEIETMQTKLSDLSPDIKAIIDASGGADGYIGPGFKNAYNMARKSCKITSVENIL